MISRELSDHTYEERVKRKERHVEAGIALRGNVQIVYGIPAPPHREQNGARLLNVFAGPLTDYDRCKLGNNDNDRSRSDEVDEHFADGLIEACGDENLSDAEKRNGKQKDACAVNVHRRQEKGEP